MKKITIIKCRECRVFNGPAPNVPYVQRIPWNNRNPIRRGRQRPQHQRRRYNDYPFRGSNEDQANFPYPGPSAYNQYNNQNGGLFLFTESDIEQLVNIVLQRILQQMNIRL